MMSLVPLCACPTHSVVVCFQGQREVYQNTSTAGCQVCIRKKIPMVELLEPGCGRWRQLPSPPGHTYVLDRRPVGAEGLVRGGVWPAGSGEGLMPVERRWKPVASRGASAA